MVGHMLAADVRARLTPPHSEVWSILGGHSIDAVLNLSLDQLNKEDTERSRQ